MHIIHQAKKLRRVSTSGVVGVKLLGGGAALLMVSPTSHTFCLLVWEACYVVGTTCNDHRSFHVVGTTCNDRWSLRNKLRWIGVLQAPQQFNGQVVVEVQGARHLEAPKNLHLMVPKSRSILLPNNTGMVMHFFTYIAVKSHRKIPKVQNFQFSSFLSEKNVYVP